MASPTKKGKTMFNITLSNGIKMQKTVTELQDWLICNKAGRHFTNVLAKGKMIIMLDKGEALIRKV